MKQDLSGHSKKYHDNIILVYDIDKLAVYPTRCFGVTSNYKFEHLD